ncbi:GFA family protein [Sphingomonas sp. MMS24-J45]|uniref:GFA family protein n=1 Tax=Sphingomonas sp. MMS24-J45 TaxID=3238806 RepID=UPI00384F4F74
MSAVIRSAACACGQLSLVATAEPTVVSVCHCLDCKRRSGSAFAMQARFAPEDVSITGEAKAWAHVSDAGNEATFHFCPTCGGTLWYHALPDRTLYAVPVGTFADPAFPAPSYSVYEERKPDWLAIVGDGIDHYD